jgi:16S rRNA (cytidine1402-2'-O)-methyltransferase
VLRAAVARREAAGDSRRDAITAVAQEYGLRKREVYALVHGS